MAWRWAAIMAVVAACTGPTREVSSVAVQPEAQEEVASPRVEWSQSLALVKAVSRYEVQRLRTGDLLAEGGAGPVGVDMAMRLPDDPTFPVSPSRAHFFMDSKLMTSSEPAIVDFELRWTTEYPEVVGVELQSVGGVPRYTYAKQGAYYVRVPAHP